MYYDFNNTISTLFKVKKSSFNPISREYANYLHCKNFKFQRFQMSKLPNVKGFEPKIFKI